MKKILAWLKNPRSDIFLFAVLLVLINIVARNSFFRIDLTGPSSYSLSEASKEAVKTLEEPLSIKVFFSANLPAPYSSVDTYVRDLLSEYQTAASSNFSVEYFDLKSDESKLQDENYHLAQEYGLREFQIREVKNNEVSFKNVFMGIVISYADQTELLDGISSTDGLEYKLTTTISKIVSNTNALTGLDGNINVTLYKTKNLNQISSQIANYNQVDSSVKKAFDAASEKYRDKLEFKTVELEGEQSQTVAKQYGFQSISWKDSEGKTERGSLGVVLSYNDKFFTIPLPVQNMIFYWGVTGLDNLEDSITQGVLNLMSKTKSIGYITGHEELNPDDEQTGAGNFAQMLSDIYSLEQLNLSEDEIPIAIKNIIIGGAKTTFTDQELYKIDQFVMKGGNLIVFNDSYEILQTQQNAPQFISVQNGLEKLLNAYGISQGHNIVLDAECYSQNDPQYGKINMYHVPITRKENINQKNPITKNLNFVLFFAASPLDVSAAEQNPDVKVTPLISSSPRSWETTDPVNLNPLLLSPPEDGSANSKLLAVLLEGKFKSAFDSKPASENDSEQKDDSFTDEFHISESTQSGKIIVISSSAVASATLLPNAKMEEPIAIFLRNAVDYMNFNEDFCSMRTKTLSLNELKEKSAKLTFIAKWFNQIGLAVLVAIIGIAVLFKRNARREKIRSTYNPDDPREVSKEDSK